MNRRRNADLQRFQALEALCQAWEVWPSDEERFYAVPNGNGWILEHPGLPREALFLDDVTFRSIIEMGWLEELQGGLPDSIGGYGREWVGRITPHGWIVYEDLVTPEIALLANVRDRLISLAEQLPEEEEPDKASERLIRGFDAELDRLDRRGYDVTMLRITWWNFGVQEKAKRLNEGIFVSWKERFSSSVQFSSYVTKAMRFIETQQLALQPLSTNNEQHDSQKGLLDTIQSPTPASESPQNSDDLTSSVNPASVFIAYSHKDAHFRAELTDHLSPLRRQGKISEWYDRMIVAGEEWKDVIEQKLETSDVILLLISAKFIASEYCYGTEMRRALERHEAGDAVVIPIVVRPVVWHGEPFADLQMLPQDARPVTNWSNRDQAWVNVVQGIQQAIARLRN